MFLLMQKCLSVLELRDVKAYLGDMLFFFEIHQLNFLY